MSSYYFNFIYIFETLFQAKALRKVIVYEDEIYNPFSALCAGFGGQRVSFFV
jgi:hypothetical protein